MKVNHKNILLIEAWLELNNITEITFDSNFIKLVYHNVIEPHFKINESMSGKSRERAFILQYDFVRRDLLKIAYRRNNNSAKGIKGGFVYAIFNKAWPDYIKIGSAIDVYDRLNSYQTSSPFRDYELMDYYFTEDRLREESYLHSMFDDKNSEWCKVSINEVKEIFKIQNEKNKIFPTVNEIYKNAMDKYFSFDKFLLIRNNKQAIIKVVKSLQHIFAPNVTEDKIINLKMWKFDSKTESQLVYLNSYLKLSANILLSNNKKQKIIIDFI
jgi:hypothetical protein